MCCLTAFASQAQRKFQLTSPDGKLESTITVGDKLTYNISCNGKPVLADSPLSMTLADGTVWGDKARLSGSSRQEADHMIDSPFYRSEQMKECYKGLTLRFAKGWSVEFRAYNDGIAYRFAGTRKAPYRIAAEEVDYRFPEDNRTPSPASTTKGRNISFSLSSSDRRACV